MDDKRFTVVDLPELIWPSHLQIPSKRFRLLVAADVDNIPTETIALFARSALNQGMVYFCAWGRGCARFHDIVDGEIVSDDLGPKRFAGISEDDVVMTTWHDDESLEEALDYLAIAACPTDGFEAESDYRIVICVGNTEWSQRALEFLNAAEFFA